MAEGESGIELDRDAIAKVRAVERGNRKFRQIKRYGKEKVMDTEKNYVEGEREFLEFDLWDSADEHRCRGEALARGGEHAEAQRRFAAANLCASLAADVKNASPRLVKAYASARARERELIPEGPDMIHCSMTMELGYVLKPNSIEELVETYVAAVAEILDTDLDDMGEFWRGRCAT